jgi:hypothetical protein
LPKNPLALAKSEAGYAVFKFDEVVGDKKVKARRGAHGALVRDEALFYFGEAAYLIDVTVFLDDEDFFKALLPGVYFFDGVRSGPPLVLRFKAVKTLFNLFRGKDGLFLVFFFRCKDFRRG